MATLYDGERYLVEKYAIAIPPGLNLLTPRSLNSPTRREDIGKIAAKCAKGVSGGAHLGRICRALGAPRGR